MGLVLMVTACSDVKGTSSRAEDPYEAQNRVVHEANKVLDTNIVRPVAMAYGAVVHPEIRTSIGNASRNLSVPTYFINHVLQGDVASAGEDFFSFGLNTVFGVLGFRDPASDAGLYARRTTFGETLAAWGIRDGAYLELPLLGPDTQRGAAGRVVDYAMNPVRLAASDAGRSGTVAAIQTLGLIGSRYQYRGIIDTLLYESADSYAASRIGYLQNKAQRINEGLGEDDLEDPYADF